MRFLSLLLITLGLVTANLPLQAASLDLPGRMLNRLDVIGENVYNQNPYENARANLYDQIGDIIKVILSFIGLLAIILFIYAGFLWMTSRGNDEQVTQARKTLYASVAGLAIIIFSYVLVSFIVTGLVNSLIKNS